MCGTLSHEIYDVYSGLQLLSINALFLLPLFGEGLRCVGVCEFASETRHEILR